MAHTTSATRRAIQRSRESIRSLAKRYGINPKTVAKWRRRTFLDDGKAGPKSSGGPRLTVEEQAVIVTVRVHTLLPLDDCLTVLQGILPGISRSLLHRCFKHHGISRLPPLGEKSRRPGMPIGHFDAHITEFGTKEGTLYLFTAIDRRSKFACCQCFASAGTEAVTSFLEAMVKAIPYTIYSLRPPASTQLAQLSTDKAFHTACMTHRIAERARTAGQTWTMQQLGRASRAVTRATLIRYRDRVVPQIRRDLKRFVQSFNFRCSFRSLGGLTPDDYASKLAAGALIQRSASRAPSRPAGRLGAEPRWPIDPRKPGRPRRRRTTENIREAILRAARARLSHDGPEGLSLSEIARVAGVSRGTAYLHFGTREALVKATVAGVSERLYHAVFGDSPAQHQVRPFDQVDAFDRAYHLASSVMENSELSRGWMLHVLSSSEPADDLFWREREAEMARLAASPFAQENIDSEVLNVIMLGGAIFFSVWANSKAKNEGDLDLLARRFAQEVLRLTLCGILRRELFPQMVRRLTGKRSPQGPMGRTTNT